MPDATIRARTDELRDRYRWGLERFIQEARTLARFDHQNIVHVHSVFEFNNTAYMVMRFESGLTLAALLDRRGTLPEDELLRIILPVLDGLELVHTAGFIHRDIKPDNIHIGSDGAPVLLDFGSARQSLGVAHTLTILVAPGYAPFEQYYSDSGSQGPWTDIYGLGATCYRAIAGRPPLDAVSRSKGILGSTQDAMVPATIIGAGRYSGRVLAAIDHALAFSEKDRPQSLADWRAELLGAPAAAFVFPRAELPATPPVVRPGASVDAPADSPATHTTTVDRAPVAAPPAVPPALQSPARDSSGRRGRAKWIIGSVAAVALGAAGVYVLDLQTQLRERDQAKERQAETQRADAQRGEAQRAEALRGAADADRRVANEKAEAETRLREQEQVRVAQEKSQVDATRKREADTKAKQVEKRAEPPRTPTVATSAPDRPAAAPGVLPIAMSVPPSQPAPLPSTTAAADPTPSKVAPAAAEPQRPTPTTPTATFDAADRAMSEGRFADAIGAFKTLGDTGNAKAQVRLGDLYAEGQGVSRDAAAAEAWYQKAALQGNTEAQMKLGAIYAGGSGAARNNNIAYVWYGTAARLGLAAAQAPRDRIGALLQPAERAQADKVIESKVVHMRAQP